MKYIIVIGDGMADNPVEELSGMTPLAYTSIPVMDSLAGKGETGSVLTVPDGLPAGSDTAILNILGYDPRIYYAGRSPLEAAGADIIIPAGEVSYRCNMVTLEDGDMDYADKKILSHNGGSVDGETALELMRYLMLSPSFIVCANELGMKFYPTPSFRHIVSQKNADITGLVLTPPHDHLGERLFLYLPRGGQAAAGISRIMLLAHELLDKHPLNIKRRAEGKLPANGLWFWAEGKATSLPDFKSKYNKRGFVVSAVPLVRGIGALAGLDYVLIDGATGELETNYEGKALAAVAGLADGYDFVLLHVEAPDECTHNGDLHGKLQAIEWLDSRCLMTLLQGLAEKNMEYRLLILSDHKTLTATRGHDGDPVPYILYDSRCDSCSGLAYNEENCSVGVYLADGHKLIERLFEK